MQTTANYGLKKPEGNDTVDIDVINGNMDTIDGQLKKLSGAMGDDPNFKTTLSSAISVKANQADFNNHVNAFTAHGIGDRTQLKTTAKDTIVNALNELKTAIPNVPVQSVNGKTGSVSLGASDITVSDSSNHFSSNPKNVENVLAELFTSGTNGKNNIYSAISAKGATPASENFSDLVSAIGNISTSPFSKLIQGADPLTVGTNKASISNGDYYIFDGFIQNAIQRKKFNNAGTLLETTTIKTGTWPSGSIKVIPYIKNRLLIAPNSSTYMTPGVYDWNGTLIKSYVYPSTDPMYMVALFEDGSYMARPNENVGSIYAFNAAGTQIAAMTPNVPSSTGSFWQYTFRTLDAVNIMFTVGGPGYYMAYIPSSYKEVTFDTNPLPTLQQFL